MKHHRFSMARIILGARICRLVAGLAAGMSSTVCLCPDGIGGGGGGDLDDLAASAEYLIRAAAQQTRASVRVSS